MNPAPFVDVSALPRGVPTLIETWLPSHDLSLVVSADRRVRDSAYRIHRWWARRPPALMRALLLASALPRTPLLRTFGSYSKAKRPCWMG